MGLPKATKIQPNELECSNLFNKLLNDRPLKVNQIKITRPRSKTYKPTESDRPSAPTRVKATRGGRSFRLEQIPQGNNLESLDESEEAHDFIREGPTQANDAYTAPDMSVDAVVLRDDPP